jgi:hypothetical protein
MHTQALFRRLRWTLLALVALPAACVATSAPRIRACSGGSSAASEGTLRILPSTVAGVEIDSAYWQTSAGTQDIGTWEHLVYYSRLRASRTVRRNELAILYEPNTSSAILDAEVSSTWLGPAMIDSEDTLLTNLHAGETTTTAHLVQLNSGFRVGKWSAVRYCPSAVQLIARGEVPFLLMPRLASDSARLAAARTPTRLSPLVVVKDSVLEPCWRGKPAVMWAAINVADTTLADMVVALVVVGPASGSDTALHGAGLAAEDTLEYRVGAVAARGRAGFVGGGLRCGERIVERLAYPATRVAGRAIPPVGEWKRVSRAHAMER